MNTAMSIKRGTRNVKSVLILRGIRLVKIVGMLLVVATEIAGKNVMIKNVAKSVKILTGLHLLLVAMRQEMIVTIGAVEQLIRMKLKE